MGENSNSAGDATPKMIPLEQLSIQDLQGIQQQVDKELSFFVDSLQELKTVHTKFRETAESVGSLTPEAKDREILVPLTTSMYVRGNLKNVETVLVDIGTGYYADMGVGRAKEYFQRKQEYLQKQMDTVQGVLTEKQRTKAVILSALESKVQAAVAAQQKS